MKEEIFEVNNVKEQQVVSNEVNTADTDIELKEIYTIEDYKQMIKMLKQRCRDASLFLCICSAYKFYLTNYIPYYIF